MSWEDEDEYDYEDNDSCERVNQYHCCGDHDTCPDCPANMLPCECDIR